MYVSIFWYVCFVVFSGNLNRYKTKVYIIYIHNSQVRMYMTKLQRGNVIFAVLNETGVALHQYPEVYSCRSVLYDACWLERTLLITMSVAYETFSRARCAHRLLCLACPFSCHNVLFDLCPLSLGPRLLQRPVILNPSAPA